MTQSSNIALIPYASEECSNCVVKVLDGNGIGFRKLEGLSNYRWCDIIDFLLNVETDLAGGVNRGSYLYLQ